MAFIDTIISEILLILSNLSEIVGITPIGLISAFVLLLVLLIFELLIFIEFKSIRTILTEVNRKLIVMGQKEELQSPESNLKKISGYKKMLDQKQNKFNESTQQLDDAQQRRTTFLAQDESQIHGSEGISGKLPGDNIENVTNKNIENFSGSMTSNTQLKGAILKLVKASDMPLSLTHIARNLSGKHFDGNYHPILNELGQLEKEGQIEGTSKGGKAYYRKI